MACMAVTALCLHDTPDFQGFKLEHYVLPGDYTSPRQSLGRRKRTNCTGAFSSQCLHSLELDRGMSLDWVVFL